MTAPAAPIRFAGASLGTYRHVCAFFNTPEEEYRTLLPFIREGLLQGECAFHVIDPALRERHLQHLRGAGIDVEAAQRTGHLEVEIPQNTYLRGGPFDVRVLGAGVAMDILRTHPMVLLGGVLHENPFYVPPDEFLRELRLRQAAAVPPAT